MTTLFSRIINREIPAYIVAESQHFIAFLDVFPLKEGHTLIVPKREIDDYFDLTESEIAEMAIFSKKVAKAIKDVFPCKKVSVTVIGLEVPHAHVHLIPINSMDDCNFSKPKLTIDGARMEKICLLISEKLTNQ
jgi:histidine triad (HIT) family protein